MQVFRGKTIYKWWIFCCYLSLPEGTWTRRHQILGKITFFHGKWGGASTPIDGRLFTLILGDFDAGYAYPGSQTWP
jgi:hypothetical protein